MRQEEIENGLERIVEFHGGPKRGQRDWQPAMETPPSKVRRRLFESPESQENSTGVPSTSSTS